MKIYIGPFKNWIGPYQIAELLKYVGVSEDTCHDIGEWLADTKLKDLCEWIESKRSRKVKIEIHNYDWWNAYHTIAMVSLPVMKGLREHTISAGLIDDEDVPEELRSTSAPKTEYMHDCDDNWFPRYYWALDEMIFALECHADDDFDEIMIDDKEERAAVEKRINHGMYLFGKYFRTLWD